MLVCPVLELQTTHGKGLRPGHARHLCLIRVPRAEQPAAVSAVYRAHLQPGADPVVELA